LLIFLLKYSVADKYLYFDTFFFMENRNRNKFCKDKGNNKISKTNKYIYLFVIIKAKRTVPQKEELSLGKFLDLHSNECVQLMVIY